MNAKARWEADSAAITIIRISVALSGIVVGPFPSGGPSRRAGDSAT